MLHIFRHDCIPSPPLLSVEQRRVSMTEELKPSLSSAHIQQDVVVSNFRNTSFHCCLSSLYRQRQREALCIPSVAIKRLSCSRSFDTCHQTEHCMRSRKLQIYLISHFLIAFVCNALSCFLFIHLFVFCIVCFGPCSCFFSLFINSIVS